VEAGIPIFAGAHLLLHHANVDVTFLLLAYLSLLSFLLLLAVAPHLSAFESLLLLASQ
jgi:hypothetical protein